MDADYSIELGPDAPALELPWQDPDGQLAYIDLRSKAEGIEQIPEARQFPALRKLLVEVNSLQSAWQTAKCDVWTEAVDAAENLYGAKFSLSCYVDLVLSATWKALRDSLELHEQMARQIAQALEADDSLDASAEIVVRRCYFHREIAPDEEPSMDDSDAGYCLTLYLSGFGTCTEDAGARWAEAMELATGCLLHLQPQ
jgi:hypothetical protein